MLIYLLSVFFIIFIGLIFNYKNRKQKKIYLIISFFILITIACIRDNNVGVDTEQYVRNYKVISSLDFSELSSLRYELGFSYLCKILSNFSENPQILIIVTSIFINISVLRFIYKNSDNVLLSTILYVIMNFYFSYMNIMRQAIAVSIILWAYEYLKKRRYIPFIILVILATMFHFSAILAIIFIVLKELKFNKKFIYIMLILSLLSFCFGRQFFIFLCKLSPRLNDYLAGEFSGSNYFGALIEAIIYIIIFFVGIFIIKKEDEEIFMDKSNKENLLIGIVGLTCILLVLVMKVSIFNRFSPYFSIFTIIWIPNILSKIKRRENRMLMTITILLLLITYFIVIMLFRPEWYGTVPYSSILKIK